MVEIQTLAAGTRYPIDFLNLNGLSTVEVCTVRLKLGSPAFSILLANSRIARSSGAVETNCA